MAQRLTRHVEWLPALVLIPALAAVCVAQNSFKRGAFDTVPENLKAKLVERLSSYVDDYRSERWDHLYDLIAYDFNVGTREEFVKSRRSDPRLTDVLLDFSPRQTFYDQPNQWEIAGCSKWRNRGELAAAVFAIREKDEWHFSTIALYLQVKRSEFSSSISAKETTRCDVSEVSQAFSFQ